MINVDVGQLYPTIKFYVLFFRTLKMTTMNHLPHGESQQQHRPPVPTDHLHPLLLDLQLVALGAVQLFVNGRKRRSLKGRQW